MNNIDYTVVIPVYRSVDTLAPLFEGIQILFKELGKTFEIIYVEDSGSVDTWNELLRIKSISPEIVRIIKLSKNFGQNGSTLCGIDESSGNKVITIDDDLQTSPSEIIKLIQHHEESGADVVYGIVPKKKANWLRRIGTSIFKRIFNQNQGGTSIGSSFRLIDRHIVERIKFHSQDHLFINQVINWYTVNHAFVDVEHSKRDEGKSGYSLIKLILLALRLIFYYTSIPLKLVIMMSLVASIGMLSMIFYYVYFHVRAGDELDLFMITVLLSMSMIAGSISIFGMYINRIYSARVKKPNYAIKMKL